MLSDINFTIDHNRPTFINLITSHRHESIEITLCMSNGGTFCMDNQMVPVSFGTLIIMQSNVTHYCISNPSAFDRYAIRFHKETLSAMSSLQTDFIPIFTGRNFSIQLSEEHTARVAELADKCMSSRGNRFGEDLARTISFVQMITFIANILRNSSQQIDRSSAKDYKKILPAVNYIHQNYAEEIEMETLCNLCFLSKYYLSHMFKDLTGFSIKNYIANYRIRKACEMISSGMSIQDIGSAVGYSNSSYFIKTFKKIVGTTPGNFQLSQQQAGDVSEQKG